MNERALPMQGVLVDGRCRLFVTLVFIICVLTTPLYNPACLLWMFLYPILTAEAAGIGYWRVLRSSLWVLLLLLPVVVFNPIYDREAAFTISGHVISKGWASLVTVLLRGLLTLQALLVMVYTCGFYGLYRALYGLGCPGIVVMQMAMLYRYIGLLLLEALTMHRAVVARGFGRRSYPVRLWAQLTGRLLIRSITRARSVSDAMAARCFTGQMAGFGVKPPRPSALSWCYAVGWSAIIIIYRIFLINSKILF